MDRTSNEHSAEYSTKMTRDRVSEVWPMTLIGRLGLKNAGAEFWCCRSHSRDRHRHRHRHKQEPKMSGVIKS